MDCRAKIGIVGPGAVGSMLGYYLSRAGFEVGFFGRNGPQKKFLEFDVEGIKSSRLFPELGEDLDIFFVAVKSTQLELVIRQHQFLKGRSVIVICNGMVDELIPASLEFAQWQLGTTTIGVSNNSNVFHIFNRGGKVVWGGAQGVSDLESQIVSELRESGFEFRPESNQFRKKKWLFNVVINSLTGYLGLENNGLLFDYREQLNLTFNEAYELGIELFGFFDTDKDDLKQQMLDLIEATSSNENSMARDIRLKRPTENTFLLGLMEKSSMTYPHLMKIYKKISKLS